MIAKIDSKQFGPWALITGASSGIGKEFARQIAASGINVVLAARRQNLLEDVGSELEKDYGVQYRTIVVDLSREDSIHALSQATHDLDIGLVISNAGTAMPGQFLSQSRDYLVGLMRLNAFAHLEIAHHFVKRLAERRRGGLLLCGAMGAAHGIPFMANAKGLGFAPAKAFADGDVRFRCQDVFIAHGHKIVEGGDKNVKSFGWVEQLIARYQPGVLVLQDVLAKDSRRAPRIRSLHRRVMGLAAKRKLAVKLISGEQVRIKLLGDPKGTKQEMAELLAGKFPDELASRLPPKRKPWKSEDSRMDIFDAVALAVALWR